MRLKVNNNYRIDLQKVEGFYKIDYCTIAYNYWKDKHLRVLKKYDTSEKADFVYNQILTCMHSKQIGQVTLRNIERQYYSQAIPRTSAQDLSELWPY